MRFSNQQKKRLKSCRECPRRCGSNRLESRGYCRSPAVPKLASANIHRGEEPPISGGRGSGTIFFAGCNLRCKFCQNYPISQLGQGRDIDLGELVEAMLNLAERGAHNINFVTPSHATVALEAAIPAARKRGLDIPVVYNTSGYDSVDQLQRLDGLVDIYMPDIRYQSGEIADELSGAPDYPALNRDAIREMHRQVGDLQIIGGIARRGLLVRHLVLPEGRAETEKALQFLVEEISPGTYVSLMSQYFPAYAATKIPGMHRRITTEEWEPALRAFKETGLSGWAQSTPE